MPPASSSQGRLRALVARLTRPADTAGARGLASLTSAAAMRLARRGARRTADRPAPPWSDRARRNRAALGSALMTILVLSATTWPSAPRPSRTLRAPGAPALPSTGAAPGGTAPVPPNAGLDKLEGSHPLVLPPAAGLPEPIAADLLASPTPLQRHEVFGFAPFWSLDSAGGFDVQTLTTLAYFGVDVGRDGRVVQGGDGWTGYLSAALAGLVTRAHRAEDRVVLTAKCFDQATLHAMVNDPRAAGRLADDLAVLIRGRRLDGANLDLEGQGDADRAALARFVSDVATRLHAADPHWQVTVDTYGDSASDSAGWYDVRAMQPAVDAFFVMAYDMYGGTASPNDAYGADASSAANYSWAVPASKVILGMPFYGYDWKTADDTVGSPASGAPTPMTLAQIEATGRPVRWDASSQVPWMAYKDGSGAWHQTWFDNAYSVALKARLAARYGLRGVGVWALGMEGDDPLMMAALLGRAAVFHPTDTATPQPAPPPAAPGAPNRPQAPAPGAPRPPGSAPAPTPTPSQGLPPLPVPTVLPGL